MKMVQEFKEFAVKGNVIDMAVGVIIGGAFGKIIGSLVSDVLMPPIGKLMGNVDFSDLFIDLSGGGHASLAAAKEAGAATINYGVFLNTVLNFLIVAFVVFLVIKQINQLKRTAAAAPVPTAPSTKECRFCCSNIPIQAVRCAQCTSQLA